jgi:C-terminal processing protease CtpA/Prc
MLAGAFAGLTQELARRGTDQVNGTAPFVDGLPVPGVMQFQPTAEAMVAVTASLLNDDIADLRLSMFAPAVTVRALAAVANLAAGSRLRGLVLDLRGNGGGSPTEVAHLLGALTHRRVRSYDCDTAGTCRPDRTDDTRRLPDGA